MAATKDKLSLDDMLKADRKKKKNEELFNSIRNKDRRTSAPGAGVVNSKRGGAGASLASRIGINKRSNSVQNLKTSARGGRSSQLARTNSTSNFERGNKLYAQLQSQSGSNIGQISSVTSPLGHTGEISIRGRASPPAYTVVASNFAPGTTASDIESVMSPFGDLKSCRLISAVPTVIAELAFSERSAAQNVIDYFNNKKADGRLLYVFLKDSVSNTHPSKPQSRPEVVRPNPQRDVMDVDMEDDQRNIQVRRADPSLQDGRYGFGDNNYTANGSGRRRDHTFQGSGLRSDDMIGRGRGFRRRGN
ncbi:hypothetical protein EJ05DRAFT_473901 [Pseudovirgaria hyperparasitica]|uniref:RRM domain-containing protein n=1 Tax=Pseudovirgaria hyperparasitica TaxID=470096 RepID=A0A6A6WH54_9PEZI|nr:uncharacterized protein EJ05DRAFT_473901 [Pseudovirgaria hyperparasitica]KAF2761400.1 hypothetical protein EJ05DRAFT_473901 [Pseudovirgaria hyperparasitica]